MKTSPAKIQYYLYEKGEGVTIEPSWHLILMFKMHYCWYRASIYCFISNILPLQIRKTIARLSSSPAPSDYLQSYPARSCSVTKTQQRKCHAHDGICIICEVLAHTCQYEEGQDWLKPPEFAISAYYLDKNHARKLDCFSYCTIFIFYY